MVFWAVTLLFRENPMFQRYTTPPSSGLKSELARNNSYLLLLVSCFNSEVGVIVFPKTNLIALQPRRSYYSSQ
jgi:hypothetical protein